MKLSKKDDVAKMFIRLAYQEFTREELATYLNCQADNVSRYARFLGIRRSYRGKFARYKIENGICYISGTKIHQIKMNAKARNLTFNLSEKCLWDLFLKQNCKCKLTGQPIAFSSGSAYASCTASLDRIDSKRGYEIENVQWIHKDVNLMKNRLDENYFIEMCGKVWKNSKKRAN